MTMYIQGRVRADTPDGAVKAMQDDVFKRGYVPVGTPRLWHTEQTLCGLPWVEYGTLVERIGGGESVS